MKTVLVIDDDNEQRNILGVIMRSLGYRVAAAPDARSGLFILKSGMAVDQVVAEYGVADMTGPELLAALRRCVPSVPVIFATRCGLVESYVHAISAGAAEYLCKPIDPLELARAIRMSTARDRSMQAAPRKISRGGTGHNDRVRRGDSHAAGNRETQAVRKEHPCVSARS